MEIMKRNEVYSCFVLHEDGTWEQPIFRLKKDMDEQEFSVIVLDKMGRKFFLVACISSDEDAPEESIREIS